jgi:membrane-bound lytic murein transglycosylase D
MMIMNRNLVALCAGTFISVLAIFLFPFDPSTDAGAGVAVAAPSVPEYDVLVVDPDLILEPSDFRFPNGELVKRALERSADKDVKAQLERFLTRKRGDIRHALSVSTRYLDHAAPILKQYGLPEELVYLCVIESGYRQSVRSHAGAVGMWQMVRATSSRFGLVTDPWVDDRMDFTRSTEGAARFLKYLYERYDNWDHALAAYNAGEGRVNRAIRTAVRQGLEPTMLNMKLPRETRNYVPAYYAVVLIAMDPERYGIFPDYQPPLDYFELEVPGGVELAAVAGDLGCSVKELRKLNRSILKDRIPPVRNGFVLKVPRAVDPDMARAAVASLEEVSWVTYKVRRGDTLWDISRKHGVSVSRIDRVGHHRGRGSRIHPGDILLIPVVMGGV